MPPSGRKFAIVAPNYHPATCGIGDHSMRLATELRRRGHEATIFSRSPAAPNPEAADTPVVAVPRGSPLEIAGNIAKLIEQSEPTDVILQYSARMWDASRFGSPALPMLAAALRGRRRLSLVAHELYTPWSRRPDLALASAALRGQFGAVMAVCDAVFVTTETRLPLIADAGAALRPSPRLGVLRVGSNALPVAGGPSLGAPKIGIFSTLAVGKRFDVVVSAFEAIWRRRPDAELIVIGDLGPPSGRAYRMLAAQIEASPAAARIHLTGKIKLSEVASIVSSLGVYLFPMDTGANTRSSTLPIAFATGVPVVAILGQETDSIFEDRGNVLYASALDGPAFARAALEILDGPRLSETLSAGGRRLFERHLSWERIGDAFLDALA
jgi:glycosyltransferase involved in cell wall biosynthesis